MIPTMHDTQIHINLHKKNNPMTYYILLPLVLKTCDTLVVITFLPGRISELEEITQALSNRKISMTFSLVSCCSCVNNPGGS